MFKATGVMEKQTRLTNSCFVTPVVPIGSECLVCNHYTLYILHSYSSAFLYSSEKRKMKRSDSVLITKVSLPSASKTSTDSPKTPPNIDYTTIEDRRKAVSWSNYCHPTGVLKPVYRIP